MDINPQPQNPIQAVTHPDPYPYYRGLVSQRPLYFDETIRMWVASGAAAVTAVLTSDLCRVRPPAGPVPRALAGTASGDIFARLVRQVDGPAHARLKPGIMAALSAIDPAGFATCCRRRAESLPTADPASCAHQLPVVVIGDLLGVPESQLEPLAAQVGDFVRGLSPLAGAPQVSRGVEAAANLRGLVTQQPSEVSTRLASEGIPADAAAANLVGFLSQSYEATAGLIGCALLALGRDPVLLARLAADPRQMTPILHEVLRFDAPVQNTRRWVAEDGLVAGQAMQSGDAILVVLAAANHDPSANPGPARFDIERADRRIFTFGLGPHACPGRDLAVAIASAGVAHLISSGADCAALSRDVFYQPSANVRIPTFGGGPGSDPA